MVLKIACVLAFFDIFKIGVLVPLLSKHVLSIGGSHILHGTQESIVAFLQLLSGPIIGSLSDTRGRKHILLITLAVSLLSSFLLNYSSSLIIFFFSRITAGVSNKIQVLLKALIADNVAKENQSAAYAKLGALGALGFIIGPVIGGYMYQVSNSFSSISVLLSTVTVISIGLSTLLPKDKTTQESKEEVRIKHELKNVFLKLTKVKWNVFWDVFVSKFLVEICYSQFYATLGLVLLDTFGATQLEMGYVLGLHGILIIVASLSLNSFKTKFFQHDSTGNKRNLVGFITLAVTLIGFYMASNFYMYLILIFPLSCTRVLFDSTFIEILISRTTEQEKGVTMGAYESIMSLAGLGTPLFIGIISEYWGYSTARSMCIFPALFATVLAFHLNQQKPKVN